MKNASAVLALWLALVPGQAIASGFNISWDKCISSGGTTSKILDCADELAQDDIVITVKSDVGISSFTALEAVIDIESNASLEPWWQVQVSGCRDVGVGFLLTQPTGSTCSSLWNTAGNNGAVTGLVDYPFSGDAKRARIYVWCSRNPALLMTAGTEYFAFRVVLDHANPTACSGCAQPVVISLSRVSLLQNSICTGGSRVRTDLYSPIANRAIAANAPCPIVFGAHTDYPTGVFPTSVAIGDLNADGRPDLAVADRYAPAVSVLLGIGDGTFGPKSDIATAAGPTWVAIGELNGDGKPDLATPDQDMNAISVLLGNGDGTFGAKTDFATAGAPTSLAFGDLNRDGKLDLAVANQTSASVSVLPGNGDGTFGAKTDFATAGGPFSVAIGDVNGDGKLDLAIADVYANMVSVLLGNGAGSFGPKTDFATGNAPFSVGIGDLNGDGKPDLAVASNGSSTVSVLLGNGDGSFGPKSDFATGSGPSSVGISDLDGDGKLDLATSNYEDNTVSVLLGDGAGGFGPKCDFATGITPQSLAIGDLNGDGKPDLATVSYTANTVSVLLNTTPFVGVPPGAPPTEFALGLVAPNPSRGAARVPFALPRETRVRLRVLDVLGRSVAVLADGVFPAGRHEVAWNGAKGDGPAPAGIYFVWFQGGGKTYVRRLAISR